MRNCNSVRVGSKLAFLITVLLVTVVLLSAALTSVIHAQSDANSDSSGLVQAITDGVNQARINAGLPALSVHPLLNLAAQAHVDDLIAHGMYGHYGSDGSNVHLRVRRTGYPSGWVSENWVTSATAQGAMDWWMNDWIHRVNILNANWDEFGVGVAAVGNGYYIFVTDFANSDGQAAVVAQPVAPIDVAGPVADSDDDVQQVPAGGMDYAVRSGDTLLGIAIRYGLDWQDIAIANALSEGDLLQIGQELRLPGIGGTGGAAAEVASGGLLYTVSSGDTLVGIASGHDIAWEDIAAANGLGEYSVLQIGMQLRLPGVPDSEQPDSEQSDSEQSDSEQPDSEQPDSEQPDSEQPDSEQPDSEQPDSEQPADRSSDGLHSEKAQTGDESIGATESEFVAKRPASRQYTVKSGDTLFSIASRNGLIWEELAEFNQLDEDAFLSIGQALLIPDDDGATDDPASSSVATSLERQTQSSSAPATRSYTVRPGDTIVGIALRLGIDWRELLRINGLNESSILQPGQTILVE